MSRGRYVVLALALALAGCADRPVAEEGESHRHLAAQWCESWCTFWYACEPIYVDQPASGCRERCESDEAWDWTDECGEITWAYRSCIEEATCEEARDDPEVPGADDPCQEYLDELVIKRCTYDRANSG